MKAKFKLTTIMLCMVMFFGLFSCQKKTDDVKASGKLQITLSGLKELSGLKSARADSINNNDTVHFSSYHLLLSVTGINGEYVLEDKLIPVYGFGSAFVSVQIEMNAGEFYLKKFMVLNNMGQVVYASPIAGSSRAYLVDQPLPLYFTINPQQTTQITPEVLPVEGFTPSDFGYVSFIAQLVNPLVFYVKLQYNPLSMTPYLAGKSVLNVYTPDGWWHSFNIDTIATKIEVRESESYEMIVEIENYPGIRLSLTANELRGTSQGNPYIIETGTESSNILILQPGPGEGMDARISDIEPGISISFY